MLKLIYGAFGSGKTYTTDTLILKALSENKRVTLLVPEQEVMEAERRIADRADSEGVYCEKLTVVSFRRLADLAFRKYGGIQYEYINDGGRLVVIWRIIEELAPVLTVYNNSRDRSLTELMLSVCNELKRYSVTPSSLSSLSDKLPSSPLKGKLSDIALIYAAYLSMMKEEYADPSDDVIRLAEILKTKDMLSGQLLFVDSFNGFTSHELDVLEYAMKQCDVTLTLCVPSERDRIGFSTVEKTEKQVIERAKRHSVEILTEARLSSENGYIPNEFRLIEQRLFDMPYLSEMDYGSDRVTLACCKDAFSEAEFIACRICELIRNGARYRDIVVIGRVSDAIEGVFDVIFEKYGIPLFYSARSSITSTAVYRCIEAALDVIGGGYKTADILRYLKTGVCGLDDADIDLIESYTSTWNISGHAWTDEYDWSMNPSGFNDIISEESAALLLRVNELRHTVTEPLVKLSESLLSGASVYDACKALYVFMLENGIEHFCATSNNPEDITVYNTFIGILDTLTAVGSDIPVNPSVFSSLIALTAKKTDFGRIPETMDRVIAGDASILRVNGTKHVFLISCENGVFPRAVSDDSVFNDSEKYVLSSFGIDIAPDTVSKNDEEMFFFLRAACSASETLCATYCLSDGKSFPSVGFRRLSALFPANSVISYPDGSDPIYKIQTIDTAREAALSYNGTTIADTVEKLMTEYGHAPLAKGRYIAEPDAAVSPEIIEKLFGKNLNMTQYRFEDYAKCPFSYYCKYILKLNEKKRSSFGASDMGTYIHRILEKSVSLIFSGEKSPSELTERYISDIIDTVTEEILTAMLGQDFIRSGRFDALISRLKRTVTLLIKNLVKEFSVSDFRPRFFELKIGGASSEIPALKADLPDGGTLAVYGTVDRVDTYEKDGNVYIRVVDYKTGSRQHSLKNIKDGIDMQMLLYLFAICAVPNGKFAERLGVSKNGSIIPAGVLYHTSRLPLTSSPRPVAENEALRSAEKKLIRSGILLSEPDILNAMEKGLNGEFIPVTLKKDEICAVSGGELKTLDELGQLSAEINDTMIKIGSEIKSGCASANTIDLPSIDPCSYCKMYYICRNKK